MNIHQVSVTYDQEQDRLLVRISSHESEELRLWLTRRMTLSLMPILTRTAADQLAQETKGEGGTMATPQDLQRQRMVENFRKEALAHASDFKTPYQAKDAALPLGQEPLLVTEVKMALLKSGKLQLAFIEKLPEPGRNVRIAISARLTQGLLQLLNKCLKKSQWLKSPPTSGLEEAADTPEPLDPMEKPRYLN
jgi:hypothetical protein